MPDGVGAEREPDSLDLSDLALDALVRGFARLERGVHPVEEGSRV